MVSRKKYVCSGVVGWVYGWESELSIVSEWIRLDSVESWLEALTQQVVTN